MQKHFVIEIIKLSEGMDLPIFILQVDEQRRNLMLISKLKIFNV